MKKHDVPPQLAVHSDGGTLDCCKSNDVNTLIVKAERDYDSDSKRRKLNTEHERHSGVKQLNASDNVDTNAKNMCGFCHSFRTTKVSGSMLHYYHNGKPVKAEEAGQTNVVHVHDRCLIWTPQVYFDGETAINLKSELSRASKLKCSSCGRKGAALGCYHETCQRSYHVPCAFDIPKCRWDFENYYVLCPQHSSKEFPCDKSKGLNKINANDSSPAQIDCSGTPDEVLFSSKQPRGERWVAAPHVTSVWILCGSALSALEKDLLDEFANLTGATVTELWRNNVTHVIASTDKHGACSRTFKILMATLSGKWVLSLDWIKACLAAKHPVEEEHHEISIDIHGCIDGPKKGRLRAMKKEPNLFGGLSFCLCGYFNLALKNSYEKLVEAAGGTLLTKDELLIQYKSRTSRSPQTLYVVYYAQPPLDCSSRDANEIGMKRHDEAKAFAGIISARVVDHQWLVDAIAASSLEP